ncbi:MAG: phosphoribosylaminoimidazolesuccinocarboxamide synthase [Candidatus Dormibacteria bacterium]
MTDPLPAAEAVSSVEIEGLPVFRRGKVRDTFDLGDRLLMVATDRLSAFDCVLPDPIPGRGRVLTQMSRFWFAKTSRLVPNHLLGDDPTVIPAALRPRLEGRMMFCRKAQRIDVECVVRARLAGSGWEEYQRVGTLAGEAIPEGLAFGAVLPGLRFTPATKSDTGHDQNISRAELAGLVGPGLAESLEENSLRLFRFAAAHCLAAGIWLVDTKFEFGLVDGQLTLIDELLTPDSSRMWLTTEPISSSTSLGFDKQLVRDHLLGSGWDRRPPAPHLPPELVREVQRRYQEVQERITKIAS